MLWSGLITSHNYGKQDQLISRYQSGSILILANELLCFKYWLKQSIVIVNDKKTDGERRRERKHYIIIKLSSFAATDWPFLRPLAHHHWISADNDRQLINWSPNYKIRHSSPKLSWSVVLMWYTAFFRDRNRSQDWRKMIWCHPIVSRALLLPGYAHYPSVFIGNV